MHSYNLFNFTHWQDLDSFFSEEFNTFSTSQKKKYKGQETKKIWKHEKPGEDYRVLLFFFFFLVEKHRWLSRVIEFLILFHYCLNYVFPSIKQFIFVKRESFFSNIVYLYLKKGENAIHPISRQLKLLKQPVKITETVSTVWDISTVYLKISSTRPLPTPLWA